MPAKFRSEPLQLRRVVPAVEDRARDDVLEPAEVPAQVRVQADGVKGQDGTNAAARLVSYPSTTTGTDCTTRVPSSFTGCTRTAESQSSSREL